MSWSLLQIKLFAIFKVEVTARTHMIKVWLLLLSLLNCWSVCNQTWFCSTASYAGVPCGKKMGLLRWRSRSQQRFKILVNVCPDDIFRTTEHFVTNLGMVMQHREPECHAERKKNCYLQGQSHSKGSCDQNMTLSTISSELSIPCFFSGQNLFYCPIGIKYCGD